MNSLRKNRTTSTAVLNISHIILSRETAVNYHEFQKLKKSEPPTVNEPFTNNFLKL